MTPVKDKDEKLQYLMYYVIIDVLMAIDIFRRFFTAY